VHRREQDGKDGDADDPRPIPGQGPDYDRAQRDDQECRALVLGVEERYWPRSTRNTRVIFFPSTVI